MMQLRIGVICEGQTDFHAIQYFVKSALEPHGIDAKIIDVQPDMGKTLPDAGWGNIEWWLKNNPPLDRIKRYFGGGLFQRNQFSKSCDIFLIQMDSDVIDDYNFRNHMLNHYGLEISDSISGPRRGEVIKNILRLWSRVDDLTEADAKRHVCVPAVESTEAWCVAAFSYKYPEPEALSGNELIQAFMSALERSEGRSGDIYANINKSSERRERFCRKHSGGFARIMVLCPHFGNAISEVVTQANTVMNRSVAFSPKL